MRTKHAFLVLLMAMALASCGKDSLETFYLSDAYHSPDGKLVRAVEADNEALGLRFTMSNSLDGPFLSQVEKERPFLTHSSRMKALERYVRQSHQMQVTFGPKAPAEISERQTVCVEKANELSRVIQSRDTQGYGGIVASDSQLALFMEKSLELAKLDSELKQKGIEFLVIVGQDDVKIERSATLGTREAQDAAAKIYYDKLEAFWARFQHDLASPLLRQKADALKALLTP